MTKKQRTKVEIYTENVIKQIESELRYLDDGSKLVLIYDIHEYCDELMLKILGYSDKADDDDG